VDCERSNFSSVLDFHNHLIPAVDDGSPSLAASADAIAMMQRQGIGNIITTPHLRASMLRSEDLHAEYFERVDRQWTIVSNYAAANFPDVRLERGFEILLDTPDPDLTDERTRLAGTKFLLVEFPFTSIPPHSARALFELRMKGYEPIVAHVERYTEVQQNPDRVDEWMRVGVGLQVNAGSLIGNYGPDAMRTAWLLVERGWASYLSSDYHTFGECATAQAVAKILSRGGAEQVELLCTVNPEGILREQMPRPVPPLKSSKSWLKRTLRHMLRR
jgi:protein-tyrosine phosphatase